MKELFKKLEPVGEGQVTERKSLEEGNVDEGKYGDVSYRTDIGPYTIFQYWRDHAVPHTVVLLKDDKEIDKYETDGSQDATDRFNEFVAKAKELDYAELKKAAGRKD